ncbi:MAG TPA: hypothetical protein VJ023_17845 [Pyrinomonadaceae bacterium]|nr:hypothetical protein [Pyrinomonadaceae bacterium]
MNNYFQPSRYKYVTICPCCGVKSNAPLSTGCEGCGARAVGEPLPKPDHELPSYGRSLLLTVTGTLMVIVFLVQIGLALAKEWPISLDFSSTFWSTVSAAQTAAWRLKWVAIPVTVVVFWGIRRIYRGMLQTPDRYCGLRYARAGFFCAAAVPVVIAFFIGVTVPERLVQRQDAIEAAGKAEANTYDRALFEYRMKFGKLPSERDDLRQLPDPDGSIAAILSKPAEYKPSADVAAALPKGNAPVRGSVIKASLTPTTEESISDGLSFTNYELRLAGPDNLLGTEDDLIVRDGMVSKASESTKPIVTTATSTTTKR